MSNANDYVILFPPHLSYRSDHAHPVFTTNMTQLFSLILCLWLPCLTSLLLPFQFLLAHDVPSLLSLWATLNFSPQYLPNTKYPLCTLHKNFLRESLISHSYPCQTNNPSSHLIGVLQVKGVPWVAHLLVVTLIVVRMRASGEIEYQVTRYEDPLRSTSHWRA